MPDFWTILRDELVYSKLILREVEGNMSNKQIIVSNVAKGHENPIAELVQVACQFDSNITFENDNRKINAKSIMGMMTLGLYAGETVTVSANGEDEEEAMANIEKFLSSK